MNVKNTKNFRDIILFPKFKNENKIQEIRKDCDELYECINPHITIVFPFVDNIDDDDLVTKVKDIVKNESAFYIKFSGISYSEDNYIFLNCVEGKEQMIRLHDLIYKNVLNQHLSDKEYIPHITIGQTDNVIDYTKINNLMDEFECEIDTIYIEEIGRNQESIIIGEINLTNKK